MEVTLDQLIERLESIPNTQFSQSHFANQDCGCIAHHVAKICGKIPVETFSKAVSADWTMTFDEAEDVLDSITPPEIQSTDVTDLCGPVWWAEVDGRNRVVCPSRAEAVGVLKLLREGVSFQTAASIVLSKKGKSK